MRTLFESMRSATESQPRHQTTGPNSLSKDRARIYSWIKSIPAKFEDRRLLWKASNKSTDELKGNIDGDIVSLSNKEIAVQVFKWMIETYNEKDASQSVLGRVAVTVKEANKAKKRNGKPQGMPSSRNSVSDKPRPPAESIPQSTNEMTEFLWEREGKRFWVCGTEYWQISTQAETVQKVSASQIKGNLESDYERLFKAIEEENEFRKANKEDPIDVHKESTANIPKPSRRKQGCRNN